MKRKNNLLLCLALLFLGFSGCKKIEQTELSIDDCQYFAIVQGTVMYSTGQSVTNVIEKLIPATGKTVYVDIPYRYYAEEAIGEKRFTSFIDANGKFELKIPIKITPVNTQINIESFQEKHWFFDKYVKEGNEYVPKFEEKEVMYEFGGRNITLSAYNFNFVENLDYCYNVIGEKPEFKYLATYNVKVERDFYSLQKDDIYYSELFQRIPLANKEVVVTVSRKGDDKEYFYFGKSNSSGIASIKIPIESISEDVEINARASPYKGTLTRYILSDHFLTYTTQNRNGAFVTNGFDKNVILKDYQTVTESKAIQFTFTAD
jgi:hypothetical protein